MADTKKSGHQNHPNQPFKFTAPAVRGRTSKLGHVTHRNDSSTNSGTQVTDFIEFGPAFLGAGVGASPGSLEDFFDWRNQAPGLAVLENFLLATERQIAWGAKVAREFKDRVIAIADDLQFAPDWLMSAMAFESGETFSPSVVNAAGSGATGLIQFMPSTAQGLGTTTDQLGGLTAVQQLDYVEKYFSSYKGKIHNLSDLYMVILFPAAVGKADDFVLFDKDDKKYPKRYEQNKGLDLNQDGKVTKEEAATPVQKKLEKGLSSGYIG
jgi:hypothetical protein